MSSSLVPLVGAESVEGVTFSYRHLIHAINTSRSSFTRRLLTFLIALLFLSFLFNTQRNYPSSLGVSYYVVQTVNFQSPTKENRTTNSVELNKSPPGPTAVIFTTFDPRPDRIYHAFAHEKVIKNWAHFLPDVQPVLFLASAAKAAGNHTNVTDLAEVARRAGWRVFPLTKFSENGVPRLKPMYKHILEEYSQATFCGYANGDILFDDSMPQTLHILKKRFLHQMFKDNALIIGRRRNVDIDIKKPDSFYDVQNIRYLRQKTELFTHKGIDYFFFSRAGLTLNWTSLADVVIGRPAYDNYLVAMSRQQGVNVIDATATLLAVHLSTPGVEQEGFTNKDASYNKNLIGTFNYKEGYTSCAEHVMLYDAFGKVQVARRSKPKIQQLKLV